MSGKFDCPRDAALHHLTVVGWANKSSGDVQAPTGWFARISNSEAEWPEVLDALGDDTPDDLDLTTLVGHFLVVEDSQGFVYVHAFDNEDDLDMYYLSLEEAFLQWDNEETP